MLAVKSLLPDKGSMRALQLPLPAQRPLQLPLTFRAATVAVAVAVAFEVAVAVIPVDGATSLVPKSDKEASAV